MSSGSTVCIAERFLNIKTHFYNICIYRIWVYFLHTAKKISLKKSGTNCVNSENNSYKKKSGMKVNAIVYSLSGQGFPV